MARNLNAKVKQILVFVDEPQVIWLKSFKTNIIAVATPRKARTDCPFIAVSMTEKDWNSYLDGYVDLRYLFTYPTSRRLFRFDLSEYRASSIKLRPLDEDAPEEDLPSPQFFSHHHTEIVDGLSEDKTAETLYVDGEWEMPDFGEFYNSYSDIYYFINSTEKFNEADLDQSVKQKIVDAFHSKPFQGGSSYVGFFGALADVATRAQRLNVDKISYESPGFVEVLGDKDVLCETEQMIMLFLKSREEIRAAYGEFYGFLSKNKYLRMPAEKFDHSEGISKYFTEQANKIANMMAVPNLDAIQLLAKGNALAYAKIILGLYRRVDRTTKFFAQGRMRF